MKQNKIFKLILMLLLIVTLTVPMSLPVMAETSGSCSYKDVSDDYKYLIRQVVKNFTTKQGDINIIVKKSKSVKPIFPDGLNASDFTTTYASNNSKVASVSKSGKLTAKSKGTANITIVSKDNLGSKITLKFKVVVVKNKAELKKQEAVDQMEDVLVTPPYIKKGSKSLIEIIYPIDRWTIGSKQSAIAYTKKDFRSITYKVKNTKIATITKKGSLNAYITGKKKGTTKLTITFKDKYGYSYSRTVDVVVE